MNLIRSRDVCSSDVRFTAELGVRWHTIGINVYPWGVRLMLVWWHYCFHFPKGENHAG